MTIKTSPVGTLMKRRICELVNIYLSESMERRNAPASPIKAVRASTVNPSEKLPVLSKMSPKTTGEMIEPRLLSVLNTPKVIPAAEIPCLDAYGIREKSVAK